MIDGSTRVAAVIGSPVHHSLSPALHNAAFQQLGIDWVYVAFHVATGEAQHAIDAMRALGLGGLSVTMPHKEAVAQCVDRLDPAAAALDSVNTVVPQDDGSLLGAGGAARSIADALGRAGAARVAVVNRTPSAAEVTAALAGPAGAVGTATDVREAHIVVNATSVGMGSDELPCDPASLRSGQVVADIVYHPRDTALLRAARTTGAVTVDGLGMLVHQAALQQQWWHGALPDIATMTAAAERELAARRQ